MKVSMEDGPYAIKEPWFQARNSGGTIRHGLMEPMRELNEGEHYLGTFVIPPFQRPEVWSTRQKMEFVESIWNGLPLGTYTVNCPQDYSQSVSDWLLDGQQRWTAIRDYVQNVFPVGGATWQDIALRDKRAFLSKSFQRIEASLLDPEECLDVYRKLAYGGTVHLPDDVEPEQWEAIARYVRQGIEQDGCEAEMAGALRYLENRLGLRNVSEDIQPTFSPGPR